MNEFANILKYLRQREKYTQQELADKLKISKSTISMYENGNREPDFETLEFIADIFNVDMNFLLGKADNSSVVSSPQKRKAVTISVLGRAVAGIPLEAVENIVDTEEITEELARTGEFFGLQIHDDSMEPRMCEGDVVIVRQQDDAESGDIVIAAVNRDDATCKRLRKYRDGIELISNNPAYKPMFFSNEDILNKPVKIIGKVVELRGKF